MKKTVDYQKLRGFNYTQPDAANDRVFWAEYHHDIVDRDMGYAAVSYTHLTLPTKA